MDKRLDANIDLSDLIINEDLPTLFEPNPELDINKQATDTLEFMRYKFEGKNCESRVIPERHFEQLLQDLYTPQELAELIVFPTLGATDEEQTIILSKIPKNKPSSTMSRQVSSWIYNSNIQLEKAFTNKKLNFSNRHKAKDSDFMQDMTIKLLLDIIDKTPNQQYIARMLSYGVITTDEFALSTGNIFGNKSTNQNFAKAIFSLISCHIGYFDKPQFGKWEFAAMTCYYQGRTVNFDKNLLTQLGITRTDEELIEDLRLQAYSQSVLYKYSMYRYADLKKILHKSEVNMEQLLTQIGKVKENFNKVKKKHQAKYQKLEKKLDEHKTIINKLKYQGNTEYQRGKADACEEFKLQISEQTKELKNLRKKDHTTKQYKDRIEDVEYQNRFLGSQIEHLENRVDDLIKTHHDSSKAFKTLYQVNFHSNLSGFIDDPKNKALTAQITEKLENGKGDQCILPKLSGIKVDSLYARFPGISSFYKLKIGDQTRVAFTMEDQNITVLEITENHQEYERKWGS